MDYDAIVVGAGSAGATLAARLAENPLCSVLLLEAGPDYSDLNDLPEILKDATLAKGVSTDPDVAKYDGHLWKYTAQANQYQSDPMIVLYGRVTGGSSAVNGTVFHRGLAEDFDTWAALGNTEWGYRQVLPYFRKLENDLDYAGDFHGRDGPIHVRRGQKDSLLPGQKAFYEACLAMGFAEDLDMNLPDTTGVGPLPMNNVDGLRVSTALGYLNPNRHRLNLTIRGNVTARRILFEGQRAVGIEIESAGELFQVHGRRIILSAGVIRSPALLMHSGVGPRDMLGKLGVPLVKDLSGVGKNLRDHPKVPVWFRLKEEMVHQPTSTQVGLRYTATGSGKRNDMLIIGPHSSTGLFLDGVPYSRFWVVLHSPESVGNVTLDSADPLVQPRLRYQYMSDPWDLERVREGVRLMALLLDDSRFLPLNAGTIPTKEDLISEKLTDQWILSNATSTFHGVGTCKMGPVSDTMAVVDQYCCVHGLKDLYVVDASVMPTIVRAGLNANVIMMAERVASWMIA